MIRVALLFENRVFAGRVYNALAARAVAGAVAVAVEMTSEGLSLLKGFIIIDSRLPGGGMKNRPICSDDDFAVIAGLWLPGRFGRCCARPSC